jgi:hypothetical protein
LLHFSQGSILKDQSKLDEKKVFKIRALTFLDPLYLENGKR